MSAKIYGLPTAPTNHPAAIIEMAKEADLKAVVVIGWMQDGSMFFSGSEAISNTIYMMRNAEFELFQFMAKDEGEAV